MKTDKKSLQFEPLFDLRSAEKVEPHDARQQPDRRDGAVYQMAPELHLAVEVALVTGRPLLLRGEPGTGKSSLAAYLARRLDWRYYELVATSATTATDLQWRFDAVRRLSDAQGGGARDESEYVEPGVLWWAFDRPTALQQSSPEPNSDDNAQRNAHRAVVLIDEIDKAHPDVPNALLVALGSNQLTIPYLPDPIQIDAAAPPLDLPREASVSRVLVVVTTNEERELPRAFIRRCVTFRLQHPDVGELVDIAKLHFATVEAKLTAGDETLARAIAKKVVDLRTQAAAGEHKPSTAEFLDALRACRGFVEVDEKDPRWQLIEQVTLRKSGREGD
ncbi:MAG: MoxR family ATPase [Acidobacteriota bacterium]